MYVWSMLKKIRPREGWSVLLFTICVSACLPASLIDKYSDDLWSVALVMTMLSGLVGYLLARSPLPGWLCTLIAAILGIEMSLAVVGQLLPPFALVVQEVRSWGGWAAGIWLGHLPKMPPYGPMPAWFGERLAELAERVSWSIGLVSEGGFATDRIITQFLIALLAWSAVAFTWWMIFRKHRVLSALAPLGLLIAEIVFLRDRNSGIILAYIGILILMLVWVRFIAWQIEWERRRIDFSDQLGLEIGLTGVLLAASIVILAGIIPSFSIDKTVEMFWDLVGPKWEQVEETAERIVPGLEARPVDAWIEGRAGLPRSHLVGSPPDLGSHVVMVVTVAQREGTVVRPNWRGWTYDIYTGSGWQASVQKGIEVSAGERLVVQSAENRGRLLQRVTWYRRHGLLMAAAGEPLYLDRAAKVHRRADDDLVGFELRDNEYVVASAVPAVTATQLRAAGHDYPPAILEYYLDLPEIPDRVRQLAAHWTEGLNNPYDQAIALQNNLRQIPYSLDVALPPKRADVVDYFLFDLQMGYCDYFASAMVVMARSLSIPARLATGYAPGEYDIEEAAYIVTEADGHSWAEICFPGYGWIPFEPTPARLEPVLDAGGGLSPQEIDELTAPTSAGERLSITTFIPVKLRRTSDLFRAALLLVVASIAFFMIRRQLRWNRASLIERVAMRWEQFLRWGDHLGLTIMAAQTGSEIAEKLSSLLQQREEEGAGPLHEWSRSRRVAGRLGDTAREMAYIFDMATYGHGIGSLRLHQEMERCWRKFLRLAVLACAFKLLGRTGQGRV